MSINAIAICVGAIAVAVLIIWLLPKRINLSTSKEHLDARNEFRQTVIKSIGAIGLIGTLAFGVRGIQQTNETLEEQRKTRIADRYAKSMEQLGSKDKFVRAAGILALKRVAAESPTDHDLITETIAAFAMDKAVRPAHNEESRERKDHPAIDVDAAIQALGKLNPHQGTTRLRLGEIYLTNERLYDLNLHRASLTGAILSGALGGSTTNLSNADLSYSRLRCVSLEGAKLASTKPFKTHGNRTNLQYAKLWGANLRKADLKGALMKGAVLDRTHLENADLRYAQGLTREQISQAFINEATQLPGNLEGIKGYTGRNYPCWNMSTQK
ncbi:pentapeptide repeat-containing protein [Streptomyces sp. N2A]|uniref:pentapeptide repeat-containing protein n=1 Tax=Streptomyces sp. N2A TaxID=3073936 RepID=UPI00287087E2|nr:pentapeptide repeat-containing protein [Streptomyces sp. N2A]